VLGAVLCFWKQWDWVIPLLGALAASVALFRSKPKDLGLAILSVVLIVAPAGWQSRKEFSAGRDRRESKRRLYQKLAFWVGDVMDTVSSAVVRSSDGWLPRSEAELLSPKSAQMLCGELNVMHPYALDSTVLDWMDWKTRAFESLLSEVLAQNNSTLDADLLRTLARLERDPFLHVARFRKTTAQSDIKIKIYRPPLLCWGLEPLLADSFALYLDVFSHLDKRGEGLNLDWPKRGWVTFPDEHKRKFLGIDRFSPQDLATWKERHPNGAGPALFGRGDPNK
jgi:hypothetical protein